MFLLTVAETDVVGELKSFAAVFQRDLIFSGSTGSNAEVGKHVLASSVELKITVKNDESKINAEEEMLTKLLKKFEIDVPESLSSGQSREKILTHYLTPPLHLALQREGLSLFNSEHFGWLLTNAPRSNQAKPDFVVTAFPCLVEKKMPNYNVSEYQQAVNRWLRDEKKPDLEKLCFNYGRPVCPPKVYDLLDVVEAKIKDENIGIGELCKYLQRLLSFKHADVKYRAGVLVCLSGWSLLLLLTRVV